MNSKKAYTAEAEIDGHRLVTFGTTEGDIKATSSATDVVIGVTNFIGAPASSIVDVDHSRFTEVKLGGTVARGDKLTAGADGCAFKAQADNQVAAIALNDGVKDDIISILMK